MRPPCGCGEPRPPARLCPEQSGDIEVCVLWLLQMRDRRNVLGWKKKRRNFLLLLLFFFFLRKKEARLLSLAASSAGKPAPPPPQPCPLQSATPEGNELSASCLPTRAGRWGCSQELQPPPSIRGRGIPQGWAQTFPCPLGHPPPPQFGYPQCRCTKHPQVWPIHKAAGYLCQLCVQPSGSPMPHFPSL